MKRKESAIYNQRALEIDYDNDSIEIVEKVEYAIEQHCSFLKVIPVEEIEEEKIK
jgi:hypothetical protein